MDWGVQHVFKGCWGTDFTYCVWNAWPCNLVWKFVSDDVSIHHYNSCYCQMFLQYPNIGWGGGGGGGLHSHMYVGAWIKIYFMVNFDVYENYKYDVVGSVFTSGIVMVITTFSYNLFFLGWGCQLQPPPPLPYSPYIAFLTSDLKLQM